MLAFFAVFGNPIAHSKSPLLHNHALSRATELFAPHAGLGAHYGRILLQDSKHLRASFEAHSLSGANITIPFKEAAFLQCDELRGIAREIGACNTWIKEPSGAIAGYNTDAQGFYECVKDFGARSALILGAGGSARAVAMILRAQGVEVSVLNRGKERLAFFSTQGFACSTHAHFQPAQSYDLVVNTTSAGLGDSALPCERELLEKIFSRARVAFDLIYSAPTPFLTLAQSLKLTTSDGRDMLLHQAALALELFCENLPSLRGIGYAKLAPLMREVWGD